MTVMGIVDLSRPIGADMPLWPGTPPPVITVRETHENGGYEEREYTITSHVGTHVDAPVHMLPNAPRLGDLPLDRFAGPACVVDLRDSSGVVTAEELFARPGWRADREFVLLWTGWGDKWGRADYEDGHPVLHREAAEALVRLGLKGLGIDAFSFDPTFSHDCPIHKILLAGGVLLVENLAGLDRLFGRDFLFTAFPLAIPEADGCPVRASALLL